MIIYFPKTKWILWQSYLLNTFFMKAEKIYDFVESFSFGRITHCLHVTGHISVFREMYQLGWAWCRCMQLDHYRNHNENSLRALLLELWLFDLDTLQCSASPVTAVLVFISPIYLNPQLNGNGYVDLHKSCLESTGPHVGTFQGGQSGGDICILPQKPSNQKS